MPLFDARVVLSQVKQAALKHVKPMAREAANAARSGVRAGLRGARCAGRPARSRTSSRGASTRSSSLYHQAKMKVRRDARPGCVHAHVTPHALVDV